LWRTPWRGLRSSRSPVRPDLERFLKLPPSRRPLRRTSCPRLRSSDRTSCLLPAVQRLSATPPASGCRNGSACDGTPTSCASFTATRSSCSTPGSRPVCLRPRRRGRGLDASATVDRLVGQCERVGPALKQWADAALAARGVRAIRLIQRVLGLTRRHARERVLAAVADVTLFHHREGQTLTVWFGDPSQEFVCEETGRDVVLIKNRAGQVIGLEKLHFSIPPVNSVVLDAR